MALLGSAALGIVMGWVSVLVGRGTRGILGVSWRAVAFAGVALLGAAALAFIYVGPQGALMASIAFGVGTLAAAAVLGTRTARDPATGSKGG
jgi:hypothetical protein